VLNEALQRILRQEIFLVCAGRTDAGVHAWGQVVSLEVELPVSDPPAVARPRGLSMPASDLVNLEELKTSLNKMCGPEISVRQVAWASADFDARRSATKRTYRYRILNQPEPDPFRARFVWHVPTELDLEAMNRAAQSVVGEHDFSSFCRRAKDESLVRRVFSSSWSEATEIREAILEISASAFCHQMVRSLVGTFVEVGLQRRSPEQLSEVTVARDRQAAGNLAPPQGLCLWEVSYANDNEE